MEVIMRFVRVCAAAAALVCSTLAGQAQAALIFTPGTITADSSGSFSIPIFFSAGWHGGRVHFKTEAPVTSYVAMSLQQDNYVITPRYLPNGGNVTYAGSSTIYGQTAPVTTNNLFLHYHLGAVAGFAKHPTRYTFFDYSNPLAALVGQVAPNATVNYLIRNAAVPEPSTWALMILGFLGVGTAMRRRRITPELARYNSPEQAPGRPDWRKLPVE
jgi:hypothetical protein